jgi:hypothetical protein
MTTRTHNGVVSHRHRNVGCITSTVHYLSTRSRVKKRRETLQKQTTPVESRQTARKMKTGPAAPVIASPARSIALKHRKTCLAQIIYWDGGGARPLEGRGGDRRRRGRRGSGSSCVGARVHSNAVAYFSRMRSSRGDRLVRIQGK